MGRGVGGIVVRRAEVVERAEVVVCTLAKSTVTVKSLLLTPTT